MKVLVIGGTGHIGRFLAPMLAEQGHEVVVMSSGRIAPPSDAPGSVRYLTLRYAESLADGSFAALLATERPSAVVDILQGDGGAVYEACLAASVSHLVYCGSVWMWGRPRVVPTPEVPQTVCPFDGYRERLAHMQRVIEASRGTDLAVTGIMPPNICGPGKIPLDGSGGRSLEVHRAHRRGEQVLLPSPGTNLIGPCDAQDVARGFACALAHREAAAGGIFNVGSDYALTSAQFVAVYGEIYGVTLPVHYVAPDLFAAEVLPDEGASFHFLEHMCPDLTRIRECLDYRPAYTPEAAMERAVAWMVDQGLLA